MSKFKLNPILAKEHLDCYLNESQVEIVIAKFSSFSSIWLFSLKTSEYLKLIKGISTVCPR